MCYLSNILVSLDYLSGGGGPVVLFIELKSEIQQKNVLMMSVQMSDDWSKESHSDVTRDFNCDQ